MMGEKTTIIVGIQDTLEMVPAHSLAESVPRLQLPRWDIEPCIMLSTQVDEDKMAREGGPDVEESDQRRFTVEQTSLIQFAMW